MPRNTKNVKNIDNINHIAGTIDNMNTEFFQSTIFESAGSCREWVLSGLGAGCSRALRLFDLGGGMPLRLEIATQKRELEKKLLDSGYSLKLAKIAVSEAFAQPQNPI